MLTNLSCQRSPFGPAAPTRLELMGIRFMVPPPGTEGGDDKPEDKPDDKPGDEKKHTDADVERIVRERLERDRRERPKPKSEKPAEKPADKPEDKPEDKPSDTPPGLTQEDVDKQIKDALAAKDAELAIERAGDAFDKALEGRTFSASLIRGLDMSKFVKDGKTDDAAIKEWVEKNTAEGRKPARRDPGQGGRDAAATGGSTSAGRDLFDSENKKKTDKKE